MKTNLEKYIEYLEVKLDETVFIKDLISLNMGGQSTLHTQLKSDSLNVESKRNGKTTYFKKSDIINLICDCYVRGRL